MCELLPVVHGFLHDCEPGGLWISIGRIAHLEFLVGVEKQDIDSLHLLHVSVPFELLPDLCAEGGDWKVEGVHSLDLGCLVSMSVLGLQSLRRHIQVFFRDSALLFRQVRTARIHSL